MSGHSKWHNIQQRKGKQDAIRSNLFSQFSKKITVAAKTGGGDLDTNFSLRLLVDKAKASGMPKDNIERAVKRGTGEIKGEQVEELMYEAYGPGGVAVVIKALSDNKNRTTPEIKHIISDAGGSFGNSGSVLWMFEQWGIIEVLKDKFKVEGIEKEELELSLIEVGVEDILEEDGLVEIKVKIDNFQKVLNKMKELKIEIEKSGLEWVAKEKVKVDSGVEEKLNKLFGKLEEHDDVDDYWTNAV